MKPSVGLWIDHRKAMIVVVSDGGVEMRMIESHVDRQPGRLAGVRSTASYESQQVPADDSRERKFSGQLDAYYDEVVAPLLEAESILILGPGEAKGELAKRFDRHKGDRRIVTVETADKMTVRQITAKVREQFRR